MTMYIVGVTSDYGADIFGPFPSEKLALDWLYQQLPKWLEWDGWTTDEINSLDDEGRHQVFNTDGTYAFVEMVREA